jgi:hypothetical protein
MNYLIKTVEQYRVGTEAEAKKLIEDAKAEKGYTLSKYSSEYKCAKAKGEIVDEWFRVVLTKEFNVEKEPYCTVEVTYDVEPGAFPDPVNETTEEDEGLVF